MLDLTTWASDPGPTIEMPLWIVEGHRPDGRCIKGLRLNVVAPSRHGALGVVWRDDPFWASCKQIHVWETGHTRLAPTVGMIDVTPYSGGNSVRFHNGN